MVLEGVKEMWTELPKTGKGRLEDLEPSSPPASRVIVHCEASAGVNIEVCLSIFCAHDVNDH